MRQGVAPGIGSVVGDGSWHSVAFELVVCNCHYHGLAYLLCGCRGRARGEALFVVNLSHRNEQQELEQSQQQESQKAIGGDWTEKDQARN